MGLRTRLTAALTVLFLVVGGVLLLAVLRGSRLYFEEVHHRVNREVAAHVAKSLAPFVAGGAGLTDGTGELTAVGIDEKELGTLFMDVMRINPSLEVYLLDLEGRILAYDAPEGTVVLSAVAIEPVLQELAGGSRGLLRGDDPRHPGRPKRFSVAGIEQAGERRGYLYIILGGEAYREIATNLGESQMLRWSTAFVAGSVLLAALIGAVLIAYLMRPLRELRDAMSGFRAGQPLPAPRHASRDEIGELATSFQAMAERIAEQVEALRSNDRRRREFVANVSHDLRTPIATIGGYLETLTTRIEECDEGEREQFLQSALKQTERLGMLVDQLYELARLEAREFIPHKELLSLAELVQDVVAKFRVPAQTKGLELTSKLDPDLPPIRADIGLLARALDNRIGNAIQYTGPGGSVSVEVRQVQGGLGLAVSDSGPGIPGDELPMIFDRFYRVERPTGERVDGTGLGLAITKRIVELHDGSIEVKSVPELGTTFSVFFGAAEASC